MNADEFAKAREAKLAGQRRLYRATYKSVILKRMTRYWGLRAKGLCVACGWSKSYGRSRCEACR